ncbi:MAG: prenyltransferase/squalene oxidase repeat-containing protein [Planctomycetota bacterium]
MVASRLLVVFAGAIVFARESSAQGPPDPKHMLDAAMEFVSQQQNPDGSYGRDQEHLIGTARVLQAYGVCPRAYTEEDGPFVRKAVVVLRRVILADGGVMGADAETRAALTAEAVLGYASLGAGRYDDVVEPAVRFLSAAHPIRETTQYLVWRAIGAAQLGRYPAQTVELPDEAVPSTTNLGKAEMLARSGVEASVKQARALVARAVERLSGGSEPIDAQYLCAAALAVAALGPQAPSITGKDGPVPAAQVLIGCAAAKQKADGSFALGGPPLSDTVDASIGLSALYAVANATKPPSKPVPADTGAGASETQVPANWKEASAAAAQKGLAFLEKAQEKGRFGMGPYKDAGITAICLAGVQGASRVLKTAPPGYFDQGCAYLVQLQKPDGSIFEQGLKVYVTSASVLVLAADARYRDAVDKARDFLIATQCDEPEGYERGKDWAYGGIGYGDDLRPDLSNTQFGLEALRAANVPTGHDVFKKALTFLEHCQNAAETGPPPIPQHDGKTVVAGTDGGGIYYPGNSQAGLATLADGKLVARSYGSMTYALLKSYILAGLKRDDPRLTAARAWIVEHYTIDTNPGFDTAKNPELAYQGLYYYYLTMARCLDLLGEENIVDARGRKHAWRAELAAKLLEQQKLDGSWLNDRSQRWWEGNPVLTTGYTLTALALCMKAP